VSSLSVPAADIDNDPANNQNSMTTTLDSAVDLSMQTLTPDISIVAGGQCGALSFIASNNGPSNAENGEVLFIVPEPLQVKPDSIDSSLPCIVFPGGLSCSIGEFVLLHCCLDSLLIFGWGL
jgi:hypothetical protein